MVFFPVQSAAIIEEHCTTQKKKKAQLIISVLLYFFELNVLKYCTEIRLIITFYKNS
jgi:hypothetical protein